MPIERLFGPGIRQGHGDLRRRCADLGLPFTPPEILSNSRLAVEAAEFAREAGRHPEFHRALLAAYFARSWDIGDLGLLGELALEVGLDPVGLQTELVAGHYAEAREAACAEARTAGVTAVPTYIFSEGTRVVGAQPLDHFRRLLEGMK